MYSNKLTNNLIYPLVLAVFLSACGGDNNTVGNSVDSSPSLPPKSENKTGSEDKPKTYSPDGFFINDNVLLWMLVDSNRDSEGVIVGLYHWDTFYFTDSHSWENGRLKTQGLTYETDWQGSRLFDYGAHYKSEVTYSDDFKQASISGHTNYYAFGDQFTNNTHSLIELTEVKGTHTNSDDGSTWYQQEDGYFIINGECTISGTATKNNFYYEVVNAKATGCSNATKNGTNYKGVVVAFTYKGKRYLNGLFKNSSAILRVNVPTS